jgi:hypothetical protein
MAGMGVRGEDHIGVPHLLSGKRRSAPTRLTRRVRKAGVDIERDVGEPDDESGVTEPPQRRGGRDGQIDFANQVRAASDRLKQASV